MDEHVCPVWIGYLLASPLRKLFQNPIKILKSNVKPGMTVVDVGSAMGFFSLPMVRLVGPEGKVLAVDSQAGMIKALRKKAKRAGLLDRVEPRLCSSTSLELADYQGQIDFALAFAVVHEVPDPSGLFQEIYQTLKPAGRFLVAEPRGHVTPKDFEVMVVAAEKIGFEDLARPNIRRSLTVLMEKKNPD